MISEILRTQWEKSMTQEDRYMTENESGRFCCDDKGVLVYLDPPFVDNANNMLSHGPHGLTNLNGMRNLLIPEGITQIGYPDFSFKDDRSTLRSLTLVEKLRFPTTLIAIGSDAFSGSLIMDMELPPSLQAIGPGSLMCCYIHMLRIPSNFPRDLKICQIPNGPVTDGQLYCVGRQFKETIINTLYVPHDYPYKQLMPEASINNIVFIV